MIHTIKIRHKIHRDNVEHILECLNIPVEKRKWRINHFKEKVSRHETATISSTTPFPGIHDIAIVATFKESAHTLHAIPNYYLHVRLEPQTIITGEQHIALFQCTEENISALQQQFKNYMEQWLYLSQYVEFLKGRGMIYGTEEYVTQPQIDNLQTLVNFSAYEAKRVDYTIDAEMQNHDEVVAFMNLAKMSVIPNRDYHLRNSGYGDSFYRSFCCGNKTWHLIIYNKQKEIYDKHIIFEKFGREDIWQELMTESNNIARIEYCLKNPASKKMPENNIMYFLVEELGLSWLLKEYKELVGFEDFYNEYNAKAALYDNCLNEKQKQANKKKKAMAKKKEKAYKPKYSSLYKKCLNRVKEIVLHKGIQPYLIYYQTTVEGRRMRNPVGSVRRLNKTIRENGGISPILIPNSWRDSTKKIRRNVEGTVTGRGLDIPTVLQNPLREYR